MNSAVQIRSVQFSSVGVRSYASRSGGYSGKASSPGAGATGGSRRFGSLKSDAGSGRRRIGTAAPAHTNTRRSGQHLSAERATLSQPPVKQSNSERRGAVRCRAEPLDAPAALAMAQHSTATGHCSCAVGVASRALECSEQHSTRMGVMRGDERRAANSVSGSVGVGLNVSGTSLHFRCDAHAAHEHSTEHSTESTMGRAVRCGWRSRVQCARAECLRCTRRAAFGTRHSSESREVAPPALPFTSLHFASHSHSHTVYTYSAVRSGSSRLVSFRLVLVRPLSFRFSSTHSAVGCVRLCERRHCAL